MSNPIGWDRARKGSVGLPVQTCAWTSLDALKLSQPVPVDDLSLQNMTINNEYPSWCVDDFYAPVIFDGTQGQAPL